MSRIVHQNTNLEATERTVKNRKQNDRILRSSCSEAPFREAGDQWGQIPSYKICEKLPRDPPSERLEGGGDAREIQCFWNTSGWEIEEKSS